MPTSCPQGPVAGGHPPSVARPPPQLAARLPQRGPGLPAQVAAPGLGDGHPGKDSAQGTGRPVLKPRSTRLLDDSGCEQGACGMTHFWLHRRQSILSGDFADRETITLSSMSGRMAKENCHLLSNAQYVVPRSHRPLPLETTPSLRQEPGRRRRGPPA